MQIINREPIENKHWRLFKNKFKLDFEDDMIIFPFDGVVYSILPITEDLIVHEQVHIEQQNKHHNGSAGWCKHYVRDKDFMLSQEVEAYSEQYKFFVKTVKDRNQLNSRLRQIAGLLSGKIYGNVVSFEEALLLVKDK